MLINWFLFFSGGDGAMYHLKILVPCIASGAIIGKGGETIAQLQKDSSARVKMSKANDFYPGRLLYYYISLLFLFFSPLKIQSIVSFLSNLFFWGDRSFNQNIC